MTRRTVLSACEYLHADKCAPMLAHAQARTCTCTRTRTRVCVQLCSDGTIAATLTALTRPTTSLS